MVAMTPNTVISQVTVEAPDNRWLAFTYSGKPRIALELGEDERQIDALFCITPDGYRTFKHDARVNERDITTVIA